MRPFLTGCALVALAACQPKIPDSAAGVGFDNAVLSPQPQPLVQPQTAPQVAALPPAQSVSEETLARATPQTRPAPAPKPQTVAAAPAPQPAAAPLATTALAVPKPKPKPQPQPLPPAVVAAASEPANVTRTSSAEPPTPSRASASEPQKTPDGIVHASPSNPAPVLMNNPGISDENNFDAVGSRRSIEEDAARIASNRENYEVIAPTAVPQRTGNSPNVVAYALSLRHPVGTKAYGRLGLTTANRHQKACAKYASAYDAQLAFLSKGGPKTDRLGLDPDGDGYACGWDPAPYRQAARN